MNDKPLNKRQADLLLCYRYLDFIKEHKTCPGLIVISEDIMNALITPEQREKVAVTFFEASVVVDPTFRDRTIKVLWKN